MKKIDLFKKISIGITAFCVLLVGVNLINSQSDPIIGWSAPINNIAPMPLVQDTNPLTASLKTAAPIEQRGEEFRRFLAPSVKIQVSGASGSGTIIYFDRTTGEAYVASCGHLWSGTRSAEALKNNPVSCKIITWYHNDTKLESTKTYNANVLFWSNDRGYDTSLLKFKPDWVPTFFPIAPVDYNIPMGSHQHSTGCDGGREVAHYDVEVVEYRGPDLVTKDNSPRPGRSGGGLLSDDGYYIATCWGTSAYSGSGVGYFTPLKSIHKVWSSNGYDWLLAIGSTKIAQTLPIIDWKDRDKKFPEGFVPVPEGKHLPIPSRFK